MRTGEIVHGGFHLLIHGGAVQAKGVKTESLSSVSKQPVGAAGTVVVGLLKRRSFLLSHGRSHAASSGGRRGDIGRVGHHGLIVRKRRLGTALRGCILVGCGKGRMKLSTRATSLWRSSIGSRRTPKTVSRTAFRFRSSALSRDHFGGTGKTFHSHHVFGITGVAKDIDWLLFRIHGGKGITGKEIIVGVGRRFRRFVRKESITTTKGRSKVRLKKAGILHQIRNLFGVLSRPLHGRTRKLLLFERRLFTDEAHALGEFLRSPPGTAFAP